MKDKALNPTSIETLDAGEYADGGGLYLIVQATGTRSWMFKYQWPTLDADGREIKKTQKIGLGSAREITLAQARKLAEKGRVDVRAGRDPKIHRPGQVVVASRSTPTFLSFAKEHVPTFIAAQKDKSRAKWWRSINIHCASLHHKQLHQITTVEVLALLKPIWLEKPSVARSCRQHLEMIFNQARVLKHRPDNERNPADWKGHLKLMLPKQPRKGKVRGSHPALDYHQMPAFMGELRERSQLSARMLEVLILTGVRTGEMLQMQWKQVDFARRLWTIPADVMKNTHAIAEPTPGIIPLCDTVLKILESMRELALDETYVFPSTNKPGRPMSNMAMLNLVQEDLGYDGEDKPLVTVHGFRTSFRTWGQESIEPRLEREILEMCLHHLEGNETVAAYARGECVEKRREAFTYWEAWCNGQLAQPKRPAIRLVA